MRLWILSIAALALHTVAQTAPHLDEFQTSVARTLRRSREAAVEFVLTYEMETSIRQRNGRITGLPTVTFQTSYESETVCTTILKWSDRFPTDGKCLPPEFQRGVPFEIWEFVASRPGDWALIPRGLNLHLPASNSGLTFRDRCMAAFEADLLVIPGSMEPQELQQRLVNSACNQTFPDGSRSVRRPGQHKRTTFERRDGVLFVSGIESESPSPLRVNGKVVMGRRFVLPSPVDQPVERQIMRLVSVRRLPSDVIPDISPRNAPAK